MNGYYTKSLGATKPKVPSTTEAAVGLGILGTGVALAAGVLLVLWMTEPKKKR